MCPLNSLNAMMRNNTIVKSAAALTKFLSGWQLIQQWNYFKSLNSKNISMHHHYICNKVNCAKYYAGSSASTVWTPFLNFAEVFVQRGLKILKIILQKINVIKASLMEKVCNLKCWRSHYAVCSYIQLHYLINDLIINRRAKL